MKAGLTPQQSRCFKLIAAHFEEFGVAPTFDEIRVGMGLRSTSGVSRLLDGLEERGWIVRLPGRARAIQVVGRELALSPDLSAVLRSMFAGRVDLIEQAIRENVVAGGAYCS